MGASASAPTSPEYERALRLFNAEQLQEMEAAFSRVSGSKRAYHATVTPKLFQELVQLPPELRGLVGEELFLSTAAASPSPGSVSLRDMVVMKGLLERGSDAELRNVCWKLLDPASAGTVPVERIRRLTAALAAACDALPAAAGGAAAPSQQHPMLSALTAGLRTLGGASAPGVRGGAAEKQLCRKEAVQEWLKQTPAVTNAARGLLSAFPPPAGPAKAACFALPNAAGPQLNYPPGARTEVCSMDAAWAWLLSALLPPSQREGWDLLYHSDIHGKSFNTFMEQAGGQGPCIVFVKDKSGQVFGGYASDSWVKNGSFYGTFSCIVFSLLPSFLVHVASGANDNFQWCGHNFREIPNGIGWGGQQGYYALFVDGSMDTGMSHPTATFKNPCLAGSERFEVDSVECWRVERPEADEDGNPTSSVLDRYKEDKVLLQLAGKMDGASDGYRHRHKNLAPEDDF